MKPLLLSTLLISLLFPLQGIGQSDLQGVIENYYKRVNSTEKIQYNINRIDSFANGAVWNNRGHALIEKDAKDPLWGFKFIAARHDMTKSYIHDGEHQFTIDEKKKSYRKTSGEIGFLGSPGGQMIVKEVFKLDSVYKKNSTH